MCQKCQAADKKGGVEPDRGHLHVWIGDNVVKLVRLGKKLCVSIATDPRKATALGIVVGVLFYFWNPLTWWQTTCDRAAVMPKAPAAVPSVPVLPVAMQQQPTAVKTTSYRPSWQQVAEWMRNDPRMMPALPLQQKRDPFEVLDVELANGRLDDRPLEVQQSFPSEKNILLPPVKHATERHDVFRPSAASTATGLTLTGIVIGPERRVAQINGRAYAVGQTIRVVQGEGTTPHHFQLIEIAPRRVVLAANGERFELTIPDFGKSERIEISGH